MKKLLFISLMLISTQGYASNGPDDYQEVRSMRAILDTTRKSLDELKRKEKFLATQLADKEISLGILLHEMARRGSSIRLRRMITENPDIQVNIPYPLPGPDEGKTPLHLAAENMELETVNLLIAAGAKKHLVDATNTTPLQAAIIGRSKAYRSGYKAEQLKDFELIIRKLSP